MAGIIDRFTDTYIVPFVFKRSEQPLLLRELLELNKNYDDGMKLEGRIPGYKLRIGRTILAFLILWNIVLMPLSLIFHKELAKIDCHLLILLAILFTGMFFGTYMMFKEWLIDRQAKQRIVEAWKNHFPHFAYENHHREIAQIYREALEREIPTKELYLHIMNKLV